MHNSKQDKLGVRPLVLCFILHLLLQSLFIFFSWHLVRLILFCKAHSVFNNKTVNMLNKQAKTKWHTQPI